MASEKHGVRDLLNSDYLKIGSQFFKTAEDAHYLEKYSNLQEKISAFFTNNQLSLTDFDELELSNGRQALIELLDLLDKNPIDEALQDTWIEQFQRLDLSDKNPIDEALQDTWIEQFQRDVRERKQHTITILFYKEFDKIGKGFLGNGQGEGEVVEKYHKLQPELLEVCLANLIRFDSLSELNPLDTRRLLLELMEIVSEAEISQEALQRWLRDFNEKVRSKARASQELHQQNYLSIGDQYQRAPSQAVDPKSLLTIVDMQALFQNTQFKSSDVLYSEPFSLTEISFIPGDQGQKIREIVRSAENRDKILFLPITHQGHWFYLLRRKDRQWWVCDSQPRQEKSLTHLQQSVLDESAIFLDNLYEGESHTPVLFETSGTQNNDYECGTRVITAYRKLVNPSYTERTHGEIIDELLELQVPGWQKKSEEPAASRTSTASILKRLHIDIPGLAARRNSDASVTTPRRQKEYEEKIQELKTALAELLRKADEYGEEAKNGVHLTAEKRKVYQEKYVKAHDAATTLHNAAALLHQQLNQALSFLTASDYTQRSQTDYIKFKQACETAIDTFENNEALKNCKLTLATHRNNKKIIANIVGAIVGLGVFYGVVLAVDCIIHGGPTMWKTDGEIKATHVRTALYGLKKLAEESIAANEVANAAPSAT